MLIALPNTDGSFTATLFLARTRRRRASPRSTAADALQRVLQPRISPTPLPLLPDLAAQFAPTRRGSSAPCTPTPWHVGGQVLLLGDAAHAIVPFHGQGMNAAFEDCTHARCAHSPRTPTGTASSRPSKQQRRPNAAAIAQMALENYVEMRDAVLDARFVRRKNIAMGLERRFPDRFIPRYSMVMFHPEIPYAEALRRGALQAQLLEELDPGSDAAPDAQRAEQLINERLPPLP